MQQQQAAALIGGIFGLVFVLANSGPPLSTATVLALRIAAIAALGAIVVRIAVVVRSAPGGEKAARYSIKRWQRYAALQPTLLADCRR